MSATRLCSLCVVAAAVLLTACVSRPAPGAPAPTVKTTTSTAYGTIGPSGFLMSRREYFSAPSTLTVTTWTKRSVASGSGGYSLGLTIKVSTGEASRLVLVNPMLGLEVDGPAGRTPIALRQDSPEADGAPFLGEVVSGSISTIPAGADTLVVMIHVGPDERAATSGVRLEVPVGAIPQAPNVGPYSP
jgi:hypothetical protein